MSLELSPETVERLVALERKFAREGLTFDDVLLVPAESRVLPNDVSTATQPVSDVIRTLRAPMSAIRSSAIVKSS